MGTRRTRTILLRACVLFAFLVPVLGVPASAQAAHYCGPRFILTEPLGYGASDFYVTNVSCKTVRHEVDRWFRARQPRHIDGWTFSRGYTIRASRRKQRLRCYLFGTD